MEKICSHVLCACMKAAMLCTVALNDPNCSMEGQLKGTEEDKQ